MSITFECMNGFSKFKISQKAEKISCEISMLPASGARALAHFLTLWAPLIIDAKISKQDCDNSRSLTNVSTNMCTFVLKETISYYKMNKNAVYCLFLDASKAFDRVNFVKLFKKICDRGRA